LKYLALNSLALFFKQIRQKDVTKTKMTMKKTIILSLFSLALAFGSTAQVKKDIDTAAAKVGNKTAEIASKGKSAVVDLKYKDKVGPHGETIYIDHSSKYYFIDKKGKKVYVPKASLKNKE
jgi:hypothetical protein